MVAAHRNLGFKPPVVLDEPATSRVFGAPALGFVERIYVRGNKLVADLASVPRKVAELVRTRSTRN